MPLLQFYTSPNQLSQAERDQLSTIITAFYARLMPAFFVIIVFNEIKTGSFFIGGKRTGNKFVRLTIEHIAVNWNGDSEREKAYLDWMGGVLKDAFGGKKGWTWEYNVLETARDLWRINGYVVPPLGSEAIKTWVKAGTAIPWTAGNGTAVALKV